MSFREASLGNVTVKHQARRGFSLRRALRRDDGWNFMEATMSVVLLTIVFLGLTITLLAFREWMTRAWTIRVMDQYANDIASHFHFMLTNTREITQDPSQYGLGAFNMKVVNFDFSDPYDFVKGITNYHYSARPNLGIFRADGNTASNKLQVDFPPPGWKNQHKFVFTEFGCWLGSPPSEMRSNAFDSSMVKIALSIQYQRPRRVEGSGGILQNRTYTLEKHYLISGFMKNYGLKLE
jgi:hypothetical protein